MSGIFQQKIPEVKDSDENWSIHPLKSGSGHHDDIMFIYWKGRDEQLYDFVDQSFF